MGCTGDTKTVGRMHDPVLFSLKGAGCHICRQQELRKTRKVPKSIYRAYRPTRVEPGLGNYYYSDENINQQVMIFMLILLNGNIVYGTLHVSHLCATQLCVSEM